MKSYLVFADSDEDDLGLIGDLLDNLSFEPIVVYRDDFRSWKSSYSIEFSIHLGSSRSVNESARDNLVLAEGAFMTKLARIGVPILGICYGAQMISSVFGGRVFKAKRPEIGWCDVTADWPNAALGGTWVQWHYESFDAPPGFEVVASNEVGIQAIRRGRTLGVQFHPEADRTTLNRWIDSGGHIELAALGLSISDVVGASEDELLESSASTERLLSWFLDEVSHSTWSLIP